MDVKREYSTLMTSRQWLRRFAAAAALALALVACGDGGQPDDLAFVDDNRDGSEGFISSQEGDPPELISEEPTAVTGASTTTVVEEPVEDTTTTSSPSTTSTTVPETTTPETTTTTEAPPVELDPGSVEGAIAARTDQLGVVTEPGDPLNVRSGPGAGNDVVAELAHLTTGIVSTHIVDVDGIEWRFIEVDGEPTGWVAGRFLQRDFTTPFCVAPADMPDGLIPVASVEARIDENPDADRVDLFFEELGGGAQRAWLRSDLSGGGVVSGRIENIPEAISVPELSLVFVTNDPRLTFGSQFLVKIREDELRDIFTVLDLQGCEIEQTTISANERFTVALGRSEGTLDQFGCIYGGAANQLVTRSLDGQELVTTHWELRGTAWTSRLQSLDVGPFPDGFPGLVGFTSCSQ